MASRCTTPLGHCGGNIALQVLPPIPTPEKMLTLLTESQAQPESNDGVEARCWAAHVAKSLVSVGSDELLFPASGESTGNTHTCRLGGPRGSEARRAGSKRY